jgi:hypothetical protein
LQCGGIWVGGKGWGLTWKLVQAVVKPKEVVTVFGKCHISLSDEDKVAIETSHADDDAEEEVPVVSTTQVADSDDEAAAAAPVVKKAKVEPKVEPVKAEPEPVKVGGSTPSPAPAPSASDEAPKKKIIKKVAPK